MAYKSINEHVAEKIIEYLKERDFELKKANKFIKNHTCNHCSDTGSMFGRCITCRKIYCSRSVFLYYF